MEIRLSRDPLSLDAAYRAVRGPARGGVALFLGSVRDTERGEPIDSIAYEAYEPMARKEIEKILRAAEQRFGARIAVHHRLGRVPVGEPSVLIAAAAPHRAEAFAACREAIDLLKERVPIWKRSFDPASEPAARP